MAPTSGGKNVFKVRVGNYASADEAAAGQPPADAAREAEALGYSLAALSGALLALSVSPVRPPGASRWVALVPLLAWRLRSLGGARPGWSVERLARLLARPRTGVVWFIGTLYWLTDVMATFGGLPTRRRRRVALLLIVYLALFPALVAHVVGARRARVRRRGRCGRRRWSGRRASALAATC